MDAAEGFLVGDDEAFAVIFVKSDLLFEFGEEFFGGDHERVRKRQEIDGLSLERLLKLAGKKNLPFGEKILEVTDVV